MNSVQVHLALTHVPVILSMAGIVILAIALFRNNQILIKTSYILMLVAGVAALPVYLSGEGTEEVIENLPGISETLIEEHEEMAKLAMISIEAAAILALAALLSLRWLLAARVFKLLVLLLAIISGVLLAQTAHLGGQIRHTEISNSVALQNNNDNGMENDGTGSLNKEKDDD